VGSRSSAGNAATRLAGGMLSEGSLLDVLEDLRCILFNFLGIGNVVGIDPEYLSSFVSGFALLTFQKSFRQVRFCSTPFFASTASCFSNSLRMVGSIVEPTGARGVRGYVSGGSPDQRGKGKLRAELERLPLPLAFHLRHIANRTIRRAGGHCRVCPERHRHRAVPINGFIRFRAFRFHLLASFR
jgi:hypothetical protein